MAKDEIIGVTTDPGSSLTPEAANRKGVLLLDPMAPIEPQYRHWLEHYDRLLSLHASPLLCPMHDTVSEAVRGLTDRVRVVDTRLGSAGLGATALRAAEWLARGASEQETLAEVNRLAQEGRFYLATHDLRMLQENAMIPKLAARFGEALGFWALLTLERGRFKAPRPLRQGQVLETMAHLLERIYRKQRLRVRAVVGDLPNEVRHRFRDVLGQRLRLESGSLAPMDPVARMRVGDQALAVFAYPV